MPELPQSLKSTARIGNPTDFAGCSSRPIHLEAGKSSLLQTPRSGICRTTTMATGTGSRQRPIPNNRAPLMWLQGVASLAGEPQVQAIQLEG